MSNVQSSTSRTKATEGSGIRGAETDLGHWTLDIGLIAHCLLSQVVLRCKPGWGERGRLREV